MKYTLKVIHIPGSDPSWYGNNYRAELYHPDGAFIISHRGKTAEEAKTAVIQAFKDSEEILVSSEDINI